MKIFLTAQTKQADAYTILHEPIASVDLMERAASGATQKLLELYPDTKTFILFIGPGNNGGDGLVMARLLTLYWKKVRVCIVKFLDTGTEDFETNFKRLKELNRAEIIEMNTIDEFPQIHSDEVLVDALLGSGLSRPLTGFLAQTVLKMNDSLAEIVSVDIPSGLFGEENPTEKAPVVRAKHTLTFQYPKQSFMFSENSDYVGDFHIIDIGIHPDFIQTTVSPFHYIVHDDIRLLKRSKFSHKGNYGHVLLVAGCFGKAGASVLAAKAAHRSGAGLVSAVVPLCNYHILQISSPETMLLPDINEKCITELPDLSMYNTVAIGPGIGFNEQTKMVLKNLLEHFKHPIVIDADAITILSEQPDCLGLIPPNSILTPHPKEFERLVGMSENSYQRLMKQIEFAIKYKLIVVLKGAHSSIAFPDGTVYFNSTGNPGMATGGSGDVLTGIIAGLLSQGFTPEIAAVTGVYLHGLAGDKAAEETGQYALIASDIVRFLPEAFKTFE